MAMANSTTTTTTATATIAPSITTTSITLASASDTTDIKSEKLYMQLNASELTAIIMKDSPNSNDRDAGFCSGSSEGGDDLSIDHHSRLDPSSPPTDASEDSIEVKVSPISLTRNKRKSSEPSRVICDREIKVEPVSVAAAAASATTAPLKKRIRYSSTADSAVGLTPPALLSPPPLAPPTHTIVAAAAVAAAAAQTYNHLHNHQQQWDPSQVLPHEVMPNPAQVFVRHPGVTTLHRALPFNHKQSLVGDEQDEPLALVLKKPSNEEFVASTASSPTTVFTPKKLQRVNEEKVKLKLQQQQQHDDVMQMRRIPSTNGDSSSVRFLENEASTSNAAAAAAAAAVAAEAAAATDVELMTHGGSGSIGSGGSASGGSSSARPQQRNYKNMTRERRIEANARERTRVHTISAAYETLRHAVPSYSNAQKLSKLSVLRVACSYILTLSRMAGCDYSEDQSEPSIASCFDAVTATIQTEGKVRKKKDE